MKHLLLLLIAILTVTVHGQGNGINLGGCDNAAGCTDLGTMAQKCEELKDDMAVLKCICSTPNLMASYESCIRNCPVFPAQYVDQAIQSMNMACQIAGGQTIIPTQTGVTRTTAASTPTAVVTTKSSGYKNLIGWFTLIIAALL